jgi:hypothetical protein
LLDFLARQPEFDFINVRSNNPATGTNQLGQVKR